MFVVVVSALGQDASRAGQQGVLASDPVQEFKNTKIFWQQFKVAQKLVALHDPSVLRELEPYLTDENPLERGNAAFVFASLGDDRRFKAIVAILDGSVQRVRPVVKCTTRKQCASVQLQRQTDRQERYYAAHLLGDLKDVRAVPILIPLLKDPDVSYITPWSLGEIGDKTAVPPLVDELHDKNPDMRVLSIYALEQLKAREALPQIQALVDDNESIHFDGLGTVAEAARRAVIELSAMH
jgi:HEAT repeat protein